MERPKIPSPERYAGKQGKLAYRDWKLSLERWFRYHDAAYADEDQKILYVGQLVTSDALTWYNTRVRRLEDMHLTDNWRAFISAMDAEFLDDHEADDLFEEMKGLKYEGSIDSYLNTMQAKNHVVGLHGTAYRSLLLSGLNSDLRERMSYSDLPEDDDNVLIAKIKRVGRVYEKHREKEAALNKQSKGPTPGKHSTKPKNDREAALKPRPDESRRVSKPSKPRPKPLSKPLHQEEKLKGIAPTLIDTHRKENLCLHCGKTGHRCVDCHSTKVTTSARKIAGQKRGCAEQTAQAEEKETHQVSMRDALDIDGRRAAAAENRGDQAGKRRKISTSVMEDDSEKED
jgi:hypothetical protein